MDKSMRIVTDAAADLPPAEAAAMGITIAPLHIKFPDREISSSDITPDDFYNRLEAMQPHIPTTSQPSVGALEALFRAVSADGARVFSIHISSGLSGTFGSAALAAKQLGEGVVHVEDSLTLSGGERFQVLAAANAARAGWEPAAIIAHMAKLRAETEVVYTLDTLKYLERGGRIGRVQALAGALLNIKPLIHVDKKDGKYSNLGRARTIRAAVGQIADRIAGLYDQQTPLWVSVLHGRIEPEANALAELLRQKVNVGRLEVLRISPVLGVHTGPGIVGVAVAPLVLVEGFR
ncbi:MAG: DegV family protein [Chloroflexi bacterium]|nr:DegV family protein [Chloroflexota bacterium]